MTEIGYGTKSPITEATAMNYVLNTLKSYPQFERVLCGTTTTTTKTASPPATSAEASGSASPTFRRSATAASSRRTTRWPISTENRASLRRHSASGQHGNPRRLQPQRHRQQQRRPPLGHRRLQRPRPDPARERLQRCVQYRRSHLQEVFEQGKYRDTRVCDE